MNKQRILELADLIEAGNSKLGFNMRDWISDTSTDEALDLSGHDCGTTACIGGWAIARWGKSGRCKGTSVPRAQKIARYESPFDVAKVLLDLDQDTASDLMAPDYRLRGHGRLGDLTQARAVATLRHLAETGEVKW
jgi:hypothetical protein